MVAILFIGSFLRGREAGVLMLREPGRDGTGRNCALEFTTFDFSGDRKGKERNFI